MSVEMVRLGELFDEGAAAPGGGAGGAGGARRGEGGRWHGRGGRQARLRATAPLPASAPLRPPLPTLPQVRIRTIDLIFPLRQQPPRLRPSEEITVRRRRAFVTFHFGRSAASRIVRRLGPMHYRQLGIVIVRDVSSECVILYFTER